ncbi:MAG: hypothetical protein ACD_46C00280G0002 [uncultured bacterium]|nr:MAG: hypothetical protein ACD_46C00280G0002 [uncultured bacterium]
MHPSIKLVEEAIAELRRGKMIILTDHPDRENEGDLIMPAETITSDAMNFMIRQGSGIVCLSMTGELLKKIELPAMVSPDHNTSCRGTPFTISIDAREGVTTGVSACDRVKTVLTAISDHAKADDLVKPGHIFPLHAKHGGVFERQGHTEGAIDLAKLAGFKSAAVLCEIMNPDGTMAHGAELTAFAEKHQLKILSIDDILVYRSTFESLIADVATSSLVIDKYGAFTIHIIKEKYSSQEHIVLIKDGTENKSTLVRLHSSCSTGDIFSSKRCDCHKQLHHSLKRISQEGGVLIYLNQEGRGIGLFNKIKSYALQEQGLDTVEANHHLGFPDDARNYAIGASILRYFNINTIRLLTNNPTKLSGLYQYGIKNITREPLPIFYNEYNHTYLKTKKEKLNHLIADDFACEMGN